MTEQCSLKERTKAELRAVLDSTPDCLPLSRLEADYIKYAGYPIRFREMGYNTLAEFVMDIPDIITCWMSYGRMMTKAVAVKSTERITSLVARQRNRTRANKSSPLPPRSREKREAPKLVPQMNSSEYSILRGKIKGLLMEYNDGIKLSQFPEVFAKRYGQYINLFNVGFENVPELLASMNDIIDIKPSGSSSDLIVQSKVAPHSKIQGFCIRQA